MCVRTYGSGSVDDGRDGGQGAAGVAQSGPGAQIGRHRRGDQRVGHVDQQTHGHQETQIDGHANGAVPLVHQQLPTKRCAKRSGKGPYSGIELRQLFQTNKNRKS